MERGEHPVKVPELRKWLESPSPSLTCGGRQSSIRDYTVPESVLMRRTAEAWVEDLVELAWGKISDNREIMESMLAIELDDDGVLEEELNTLIDAEKEKVLVKLTGLKRPRRTKKKKNSE